MARGGTATGSRSRPCPDPVSMPEPPSGEGANGKVFSAQCDAEISRGTGGVETGVNTGILTCSLFDGAKKQLMRTPLHRQRAHNRTAKRSG